MSTKYTDLENTNYPDSFDVFEHKSDLSQSMMSVAAQYKTYMNNGNYGAAKQIIETYPALRGMLITAEDFNKLQDAMMAMQRVQQTVVVSNIMPSPATHPNQSVGNYWIQPVTDETGSYVFLFMLREVTETAYDYIALSAGASQLETKLNELISGDGTVKNAEKLGGHNASYYVTKDEFQILSNRIAELEARQNVKVSVSGNTLTING